MNPLFDTVKEDIKNFKNKIFAPGNGEDQNDLRQPAENGDTAKFDRTRINSIVREKQKKIYTIEKLNEDIENKKAQCLELHQEYIKYLAAKNRYASMFEGDGGIVQYMQRLLGFYRYDMANMSFADREDEINGLVINGMCVVFDKYSMDKSTAPTAADRERYMRNLGIFTVDLQELHQPENLQKLDSWISDLEKKAKKLDVIQDIKRSDIDQIDIRHYQSLYDAVGEDIQKLKLFCRDEMPEDEAGFEQGLAERLEAIKSIFQQFDICFFYYDEADEAGKEAWFHISDSADCCPAVVNGKTSELILKGQITAAEISL